MREKITNDASPSGAVLLLLRNQSTSDWAHRTLQRKRIATKCFPSGAAILAGPPPTEPACLVTDLPGTDRLRFVEQLRSGGWDLPLIVLAEDDNVRMAVHALRTGVTSILPLPCAASDFLALIDWALAQAHLKHLHQTRSAELGRRLATLSSRECEVLRLIIAGMLNKQIAAQLRLALVTIKVHRASAMRKLGARNAAELARLALMVNDSESPNGPCRWPENPGQNHIP